MSHRPIDVIEEDRNQALSALHDLEERHRETVQRIERELSQLNIEKAKAQEAQEALENGPEENEKAREEADYIRREIAERNSFLTGNIIRFPVNEPDELKENQEEVK